MNEDQTFDNVLAQKFNTLSLLRFAFPTIAIAKPRRSDPPAFLCAGRLTADRPPSGGNRRCNSVLCAPKEAALWNYGSYSNFRRCRWI